VRCCVVLPSARSSERPSKVRTHPELECRLPRGRRRGRSRVHRKFHDPLGTAQAHENGEITAGTAVLGPTPVVTALIALAAIGAAVLVRAVLTSAALPDAGYIRSPLRVRTTARAGRDLHLHVSRGRDTNDKTPPHPQQQELGQDHCQEEGALEAGCHGVGSGRLKVGRGAGNVARGGTNELGPGEISNISAVIFRGWAARIEPSPPTATDHPGGPLRAASRARPGCADTASLRPAPA
jgi:hypothetical protein